MFPTTWTSGEVKDSVKSTLHIFSAHNKNKLEPDHLIELRRSFVLLL